MIRIHHAPEALMFSLAMEDDETLRQKAAADFATYHCVAEVNTENTDEAYRLTNTIEAPWWLNTQVKFLGSAQHGLKGSRSTSIGDVLELDNGTRAVVARFGFVTLS